MNGNVLVMTLVIALEPIPILGGVLLLTVERGRPKAIAFLLGWALALAIIGVAIIITGGLVSTPSGSASSKASATLDVVLGLALAAFAFRTRAKTRNDVEAGTPAWMKRLDTMSPVAAFVLGMFLPPYMIAVAIGNDIVRQDLSTAARVTAVVLYVIIGSLGILVPIMVTVVRPKSSDAVLAGWRVWLQRNWPVLLFWLLVGIGVYLVIKGVIEFAH